MNENQEQAVAELVGLRRELRTVSKSVYNKANYPRGLLTLWLKNRVNPSAIDDEYSDYRSEIYWSESSIEQGDIPRAIELLTSLKERFDSAAKPRDASNYKWLGKLGKEIKNRELFPAYAQKVADVLELL